MNASLSGSFAPPARKVHLVVLNYNGRDLLEKYLPSVLREAKASRHKAEVTVVDNHSNDGSEAFVRQYFPEIKIWPAKENRVLSSYNDFLAQADGDIAILLNNDMELKPGFVDPMIEPFEKEKDVFFTAPHSNRSIPRSRWGILEAVIDYPGSEALNELPGLAFAAGTPAVDIKKFLELDGYDPLYLPGRYEDVDLCYRAWKKGWKGFSVPMSRHYHEGGTSFKKAFGWKQTQRLVFRNSLLFMTKNITDNGLIWKCRAGVFFKLCAALMTGKFFLLSGYLDYRARRSLAVSAKQKVKKNFVLKDREVLALFPLERSTSFKVRFFKGCVEFLSSHRWVRTLFFWPAFFTVRLMAPVQYLILRELMDSKSVVDLGCGPHSMVPILSRTTHTVGLEYFKPYFEEAQAKARHSRYVHADITKVDFPDKSFDAAVMLDVIEHLTQEEGEAMIKKMERWARKKIVIFTPNGYLHQEELDENPLMAHKSGWTHEDFARMGFKVYGVRGFKALKKNCHDHDQGCDGAVDSPADITQLITYHFPQWAFQLFAVKELPNGN